MGEANLTWDLPENDRFIIARRLQAAAGEHARLAIVGTTALPAAVVLGASSVSLFVLGLVESTFETLRGFCFAQPVEEAVTDGASEGEPGRPGRGRRGEAGAKAMPA
jgi:hypothetical protein